MGNQLTGIAPSQILPVEQYLTDVPQFHFVEKYISCSTIFKLHVSLIPQIDCVVLNVNDIT